MTQTRVVNVTCSLHLFVRAGVAGCYFAEPADGELQKYKV